MRALETAIEWLRPLVQTKAWDYCVVWELGDDPSRFIEWMGCCCSGSYGEHVSLKEGYGGEQHLLTLCRDEYIQHFIQTKACEALAHFPPSMPLYSGIHGEVVLSTQPSWLTHCNTLNSNGSHESSIGTQVLIPVVGGLIELFSANHIPKDQKTIELIIDQFNISMEQEAKDYASNVSLNELKIESFLDKHHNINRPKFHHHYQSFTPNLQFIPTMSLSSTYPNFEGSSTCSSPSNGYSSFKAALGHGPPKVLPNESIGKDRVSKKLECNQNMYTNHEIDFILEGRSNHVVEKDNLKVRQSAERGQYYSKNLITERNRRNRIKEALFALRALVPKISKMDKAAILGDAIEYIGELETKVKNLQDELREMAEEDCNNSNNCSPPTEHNQGSLIAGEKEQIEVQVDVNQFGPRDFLVKVICEQRRGGFARLIEAMNSLGFEVRDANVTTLNGKVLNILKAEGNRKEVQPKELKDSLMELTSQTCQTVSRKRRI